MSRHPFVFLTCLLAALGLAGCGHDHDHDHAAEAEHGHAAEGPERWAVTAWSPRYELFAETEPLIAGAPAESFAHFTWLPDFSPVSSGSARGILRGADGQEESFVAAQPLRAGIFAIVFTPTREGTFELAYEVGEGERLERIAAGTVTVGSAAAPGGLVTAEESVGGEAIGFLKEQQWRTPFATSRAQEGTLRPAVRALATVRPAAGGEALLTAPADGVVRATPWPHVGLEVARGKTLFELSPRAAGEATVAGREAERITLEAELGVARSRLERLQALLAVEATSRREVEEAEARVTALAARLAATEREQQAARAVRQGGGGPESFAVRAPIAGRVATLNTSQGQFVAAGTVLGRLVQSAPVWLELAVAPREAARLAGNPAGLVLRRWSGSEALAVSAEEVRWIGRGPELDAATGTLSQLLEVQRDTETLPLGSRIEVEVLLAGELAGIVVPSGALVDDSGIDVVYVQREGESFERREVRVELRQGEQALVQGLRAGERIVVRGGEAIRRASLLGSSAVEGHVH
jgi:membrane fusion protein, heavy metal efflux system